MLDILSHPPAWLSPAANWGGLVGLVVTILGFVATLKKITSAKQAAIRAEEAARDARSHIVRHDAVAELAVVVRDLEDISRLHREAAWQSLPPRYAAVRRILIAVKAGGSDVLLAKQRTTLQAAIAQFSKLEEKIEQHMTEPSTTPNPAMLNSIIAKHGDSITQLLAELRLASGAK
jgi:hypothetical protein